MKVVLNITRLLVGVLFLVSGLIKANDALGFAYKLEDYFVVFEDSFWNFPFTKLNAIALPLSMFICALEIFLGIAVLIGYKLRSLSWVLLFMIIFFTWLTGYSAITGKVTDCGCFGDAIPLTPMQSFQKDIVLLLLIGFIFVKRKSIQSILLNKISAILSYGGGILCIVFSIWCYYHLPVKDFRHYKIGGHIPTLMNDGVPDVKELAMIYKHKSTGEVKEFINTTPKDWENWDYVDRKDKIIKAGKESSIHDFVFNDDDGNEVTDIFVNNPGYTFLIISKNVIESNKNAFTEINKLAEKANQSGIQFIGLTSTPYEQLDPFRHEVQATYSFYYGDATTLKTMIRSNPGLMLIKNGTILGKWHYNDIPSFEEVSNKYIKD